MQLRHKFFIVLILLSSVPLLILLFGAVERLETELTSRTHAEMHSRLDKVAGEITLILQNQQAIAKGLAEVRSIRQFAGVVDGTTRNPSPANYSQQADALEQFFLSYQRSVPNIQALRFINKDGKTLVKVKEGKPISPTHHDPETGRVYVADQSKRNFFTMAMQTSDEVVMSNFELGHVTQDADFCPAMVRYSVPIKDEVDNIEGVLVVNMWGRRFDSTIEATLGSESTKSYVVELNSNTPRDGIYLYHRETDKRFANQLQSNYRFSSAIGKTAWQQISKDDVNQGSLFLNDGRMLFYTKLAPYPDRPVKWLLVLEADYDQVYAAIIKMRESIWFLLAILLFVSFLVAVWASGSLTRSVHNLAEIIRRFADGDRKIRYHATKSKNDEIEKAGLAFNYLTATLETTEKEREEAVRAACQSERLVALGQLAAGIGHEINNPLMNIMSLANLIEESLPDASDEVKNDLLVLKKEGKRCASIVQGILSFAREKKPTFEHFDFAELINETLTLLHHRIESSGLIVNTNIDENLEMNGDPNLLQQVLVNIVLNAVQASVHGSTIAIAANKEQDIIKVVITDSGCGINDDNLSKIFDPFFTTKGEGEGTGLGLSVSYGIIKRHQGELTLKNNKDGGVVVTLSLPINITNAYNPGEVVEDLNVG